MVDLWQNILFLFQFFSAPWVFQYRHYKNKLETFFFLLRVFFLFLPRFNWPLGPFSNVPIDFFLFSFFTSYTTGDEQLHVNIRCLIGCLLKSLIWYYKKTLLSFFKLAEKYGFSTFCLFDDTGFFFVRKTNLVTQRVSTFKRREKKFVSGIAIALVFVGRFLKKKEALSNAREVSILNLDENFSLWKFNTKNFLWFVCVWIFKRKLRSCPKKKKKIFFAKLDIVFASFHTFTLR